MTVERAVELALRHLGRRDRTVAQVRAHLEGRDCAPDAVDAAVGELTEAGYLDDARFAERFAEDRRRLDGWGPERIARALAGAGVPAELAAPALAAQSADDDRAAAVALLRRRLRVPPADDRGRARALGLLVRRGYELELAHDAVRAFTREQDAA